MCGIFGYKGKIEQERALTCLRTLAHRGPDGEGIYHNDDIFLGHRRLAILDLSENGKQPMSYADERYWITFNGEIYNFIEIREELLGREYKFKSDSDTEVILASFIEWGEKCLDKFNGMWAFAIWDNLNKELFLSRDRFGKKPLFYSFINNDFVFGSEMKAIAPLLGEIEPDMDIVHDLEHIFYYESTDKCLVKGIKRFPAGHFGRLRNGELELTRYWCTLDHLIDVPETYEGQVQKFRELFLDACKIRMRSDVPIGTALSGGLDSSATFCALNYLSTSSNDKRISHDWQHAFSASFPGTPIDETEWAKKVAEYCDAKINVVEIKPENYLSDFYQHIYLFEDLYITPHIPFVATYAAMKNNGVSVTLDGHGADELFGGYSFDYIHILHDNMFNFRDSKDVVDVYYDSQLIDNNQFAKLPSKYIFLIKQFVKNAGKKLLNYKNKNQDDKHPNWKKMDYFTQKLYISFHQTVLPTLLRNYDRYSMINGVEIRMPFLDHRLVSYAFSLSWRAKIRNGYTKSIIRDALADIMPNDVVYRKTKIGFNSPMVDWFKGPLKNFFLDIISSGEFKNNKIVNSAISEKYIKDVIEDPLAKFHDAERAWKMIVPYFWFKGFINKIKKV